jgi:DNA-binding LytR/AlgR family response regulator
MIPSLKILIVEDETITAADIEETLEQAGHEIVAIARNHQQALVAVKKSAPDLALIDITLADGDDGIRTAESLLQQHWMPVIYLTAHSEQETFERAKQTIPAAYLLKPFRKNELAMQVEIAWQYFHAREKHDYEGDDLFLPINKGYEKVNKANVVCLKAEGAYVQLCQINDDAPLLITMNIGYLAQYFPGQNFYRLSRSLLINLAFLERIERNQILMRNQKNPLPLPEANRAELLKRLTIVKTR